MKKNQRLQKNITPIYMDETGYQELLDSIQELKKEIALNNKGRREAYKAETGEGWISAEFEEIERIDNMLMCELNTKYEMLSRVVIIKRNDDVDTVNLGDVVRTTIFGVDDEPEEKLFKIIGGMPSFDLESEIQEVSINSPAGRAMFQKNIGETVTYSVNNMDFTIIIHEIVDIKKDNKVKKLVK